MSLPVRKRRRSISTIVPFLVVALVFSVLIWQKYQVSREVVPVPGARQPSGERQVVLFFVAEGTRLAREGRELEGCQGTESCVRSVVEELLSGPVGELDEALPEGTLLRDVRVEGSTAVVDLSRDFAEELPAGSSAEMLAVYSIVDTICINFPSLTGVRLSVEGNRNTVLSHLDLSEPLAPDYTLEKQPPAQAPAARSTTSEKRKGH